MLLLCLALFVSSSPIILQTTSLPLNHYSPELQYDAAYTHDGPHGSMQAIFSVKTLVKTVNLENLPKMIDMHCTANQLILKFKTQQDAFHAYGTWKELKRWAVIVGHERNCNGGLHSSFLVNSQQLSGNVIRLDADIMHWHDLVKEYSLVMSEERPAPASGLYKRDTQKYFQVPLNLNIDPVTQKVKSRFLSIRVGEGGPFDFRCTNCTSSGALQMYIRIKGTPTEISEVYVKALGRLAVNFDVGLRMKAGPDLPFIDSDLLKIPITPFTIPGLYTIGPQLRFSLYTGAGLRWNLFFKTGMHMSLPINFTSYFKAGLTKKPITKSLGSPVFTLHETAFETNNDGRFTLGISTSLGLTISAMSFKGFDFGISWNNALQMRLETCAEKLGKAAFEHLKEAKRWMLNILALQETTLRMKAVGSTLFDVALSANKKNMGCVNCNCKASTSADTDALFL
jgi:hypothetical protein